VQLKVELERWLLQRMCGAIVPIVRVMRKKRQKPWAPSSENLSTLESRAERHSECEGGANGENFLQRQSGGTPVEHAAPKR